MSPMQHFHIHMDEEKCVGCNRCIRVCPIETANIASEDENGNIRVTLDPTQCIYCGACISVCDHSARVIDDDTERFFRDLARGETISVMAAPSIQTNIPQWKRLFAWLKKLGVAHVYDVSLGADICIWAHLRLLEKRKKPIITQPCPTIVGYCQRHRHELLPYLSPVHSPMACAAIYMRKQGVSGRIASISPCIAKAQEHRETGLVQYSLTFKNLLRFLEKNNISLPEEESDFEHRAAGPGVLFPLPGGLRENLDFFTGSSLHVEKREGPSVFAALDQYAATEAGYLPDVFDVLGCADGCLMGSAAQGEKNPFMLYKKMQEARQNASRNIEESRKRLEEYDRQLPLEDFMRTYVAYRGKSERAVSEEDIERAFQALHKTTFEQRRYNCGACGSNSCYEMARKIALNVNIPDNCVILSRDQAKQERERNAEYLALVQSVGDNLFATQDEDYPAEVKDSLRTLSETINCSAVAIWRRTTNEQGQTFERVNGWYGDKPESIAIYGEWPADWAARLARGEHILVNASQDKPGLFPEAVTTLFIVPIHIRGEFWGFVDAISVEDRVFAEEEASLLEATGILLITGILERELHGSLISAREDALAGTRAKSDFLSRMSHEIRTPMNAIIGMTHMGSTARDLERKDYCLDKISSASEHLLGVINDILDMSKIEADKFELSNTWFRFEKMLQNVTNVIIFRMEDKNQLFTVDIDPRIPALLEADDQRLAQVITNLLGNAVKFTPEQGRIKLSAWLEERAEDLCTIRMDVADSGIGIPEEARKRLFRSFEQAESGTSRKFGGTGLGLAISRRIVELMDGAIWVESEPGRGSTFSFTFKARGRRDEENRRVCQSWKTRPKILAVDDDPAARQFFASIAERFNFHCDTAASGSEAQELVRGAGPYDVCFMDYQLPDTNGVLLAQKLFGRGATTPEIVLISGLDRGDIEAESRAAGISRFLSKPLFASSLIDYINEKMGPAGAVPERPEESEVSSFAGRRVLLAEDVEVNREIFSAMLEDSELEIEVAENGRIALDKFQADPERYDLILMDVQMPEMDGFEATQAIRSLDLPRAAGIPIVAMTANVFREDIEKCRACGMDDHIGKPIDYEEMMKKLRRYLFSERTLARPE